MRQGEEDVAVEASPSMRVRQRLKGSKAELSWLMRTTYISNEVTPSSQVGTRWRTCCLCCF